MDVPSSSGCGRWLALSNAKIISLAVTPKAQVFPCRAIRNCLGFWYSQVFVGKRMFGLPLEPIPQAKHQVRPLRTGMAVRANEACNRLNDTWILENNMNNTLNADSLHPNRLILAFASVARGNNKIFTIRYSGFIFSTGEKCSTIWIHREENLLCGTQPLRLFSFCHCFLKEIDPVLHAERFCRINKCRHYHKWLHQMIAPKIFFKQVFSP